MALKGGKEHGKDMDGISFCAGNRYQRAASKEALLSENARWSVKG
jgi:hypothetical protein